MTVDPQELNVILKFQDGKNDDSSYTLILDYVLPMPPAITHHLLFIFQLNLALGFQAKQGPSLSLYGLSHRQLHVCWATNAPPFLSGSSTRRGGNDKKQARRARSL